MYHSTYFNQSHATKRFHELIMVTSSTGNRNDQCYFLLLVIYLLHTYFYSNLLLKIPEFLFLFQLFTKYFSRPIKIMFHGSVEFNLTVRALGQRFFLTFYASSVTGKIILGGKKCSFCYFVIYFIVAVVFVVVVVVVVLGRKQCVSGLC